MPNHLRASAVVGVVLSACSAAEHDRDAWLRHTLVLDNQDFLERDPELTAGKFAKMSESPFAFLRGTAGQFARDVFEPGGAGLERWAFVDDGPNDVALVGDPHPENFGSFRIGDGTLTADFNDFDAATYGPFEYDVRRLAVGFWVACEQMSDALAGEGPFDLPICEGVAAQVARGYADEVVALAADPQAATIVSETSETGAIVEGLLAAARAEGEASEVLADYTDVDGDRRALFEGDVAPARLVTLGAYEQLVFEDTVRRVDAPTLARIESLIDRWPATLATGGRTPGPLLGALVRWGAGVSSYPLLRWYALLGGPTDAVDDDLLLEVKELRDAVPLPGARRPIDAPFDGNGPRVIGLQRELQGFIDGDPWLGYADEGAVAFRIRERTSYQRGFRVDDLAPAIRDGSLVGADLLAFAATCGRVLGRSHARARRASGSTATSAIASALGDGDALVDAIVDFVARYGPVVLDDHARFVELLASYGPRLGYL